jgi:murein L,D-transpeptidase YafK
MRTNTHLFLVSLAVLSVVASSAEAQRRVVNRDAVWQQRCDSLGISYPPPGIALVAYKEQNLLEVWAMNRNGVHTLLHTYPICRASGDPGPKRVQGDGQVPEGMYVITRFNPVSSYHLSLGINYPNAGDRKRSAGLNPGGDIYIHGSCVSIGCLAMTNPFIEEIYWIANRLRRTTIPVLMFPTNDALSWSRHLSTASASIDSTRHRFWTSLKPLHDTWLANRRIPSYTFDADGLYVLRSSVVPGTSSH